MLIVDAQIHLWNAGKQIPAYLKSDALAEMDAGGVDAAVLTPHTPWDPNANELCIEAVRQHPDRFGFDHRLARVSFRRSARSLSDIRTSS